MRERERDSEGGRWERERDVIKVLLVRTPLMVDRHISQLTKLNSYRVLHDPVDELTARLRVRVQRIQGSGITIPLFTNLVVNLHGAVYIHMGK